MILHGRNLIIKADGEALAASKSCTIDIQSDDIEVSSPLTGIWKTYIAGRRSWKVSASGLVTVPVDNHVGVVSAARGAFGYASVNGQREYGDAPGFHVVVYLIEADEMPVEHVYTYDMTQPDGSLDQGVTSVLTEYPPSQFPIAIFTDANADLSYGHDIDVWATIKQAFGIEFVTPASTAVTSFALFSTPEDGATFKVSAQGLEVGVQRDLYEGRAVKSASTLKAMAQRVGQMFTLSTVVRGTNGEDEAFSGQALCKRFHVAGAVGNLIQGSFEFQGSGALE